MKIGWEPPIRESGIMRQNKSKGTAGKGIPVVSMIIVLLLVILMSISSGSVRIPIGELIQSALFGDAGGISDTNRYIFTQVRLPRVILCTLTGMSLGLSGCIMQSILRNPLASPFTLGVSSGASFGAALAMVLGANVLQVNFLFSGYSVIAVNAFLFGCVSLLIVYLVSRLCNNSMTVLILTGTAISSLFSAGVSILKYISSAEALKNLDIWLMGGFWGANWKAIMTITPFLVVTILFTMRFAWDLNAMNAGEDIAATLGVNIKVLKGLSMLLVTLVASVSIAFCGVIGFIGLIAPHIARSLTGVDNRYLIPASAMMGAIILLVSDTVARTVILPKEIPVGIITSLLGVPFFILILARNKKQMWGG